MSNSLFNLTILGSSSAIPTKDRRPSAQLLEIGNKAYLIDCGEGTQMQLNQFGKRASKITAIFISHLHGDHILGLPGLLNSMALSNRKKPLVIISPVGLKKFIGTYFLISHSRINFSLEFVEISNGHARDVYSDNCVNVKMFPLRHRIETIGFKFIENITQFNLKRNEIEGIELSYSALIAFKNGMNIYSQDKMLKFQDYVHEKNTPMSYAYCSDTSYFEELLNYISGVKVLYHESTYLDDLKELAKERGHSTAKQAGIMAKEAGAEMLILGHYSSRYMDLSVLLKEAKQVFKNTYLAIEGREFVLD